MAEFGRRCRCNLSGGFDFGRDLDFVFELYPIDDFRQLNSPFKARSRFAEHALSAAVPRGVRQTVILGAGLDTFSLGQSICRFLLANHMPISAQNLPLADVVSAVQGRTPQARTRKREQLVGAARPGNPGR